MRHRLGVLVGGAALVLAGFVATVTVRNVSADPLDSWRVSWTWPGTERVVSLWNGVVQAGSVGVTVGNASYNGRLSPAGSTTFGMLVAAGAPPTNLVLTCA